MFVPPAKPVRSAQPPVDEHGRSVARAAPLITAGRLDRGVCVSSSPQLRGLRLSRVAAGSYFPFRTSNFLVPAFSVFFVSSPSVQIRSSSEADTTRLRPRYKAGITPRATY